MQNLRYCIIVNNEVLFSAGWDTKEAENVFSHTAGAWDESQGEGVKKRVSRALQILLLHPP